MWITFWGKYIFSQITFVLTHHKYGGQSQTQFPSWRFLLTAVICSLYLYYGYNNSIRPLIFDFLLLSLYNTYLSKSEGRFCVISSSVSSLFNMFKLSPSYRTAHSVLLLYCLNSLFHIHCVLIFPPAASSFLLHRSIKSHLIWWHYGWLGRCLPADWGGELDFSTFLSIMHRQLQQEAPEEEILEAMKMADKEQKGFILASELRAKLTGLGEKLTNREGDLYTPQHTVSSLRITSCGLSGFTGVNFVLIVFCSIILILLWEAAWTSTTFKRFSSKSGETQWSFQLRDLIHYLRLFKQCEERKKRTFSLRQSHKNTLQKIST